LILAHYRLALSLLLACGWLFASGQEASPDLRTQPAVTTGAAQDQAAIEQVPRVPGMGTALRSFNAGLTFSLLNDAYSGSYTVITPALSYTLSPHFSADLSLSAYLQRAVKSYEFSVNPEQGITEVSADKSDLGDLFLAFHGTLGNENWRNLSTLSLTMPTGSQADGLSTGSVTADFSTRLERSLGPAGVMAEVGLGNSAGLFNSLVTREYNSLGPLSHYQAGVSLWLPGSVYLQSVVYEQLPFGRQTVYETLRMPGSQQSMTMATTFSADDNGSTTFASLPLQAHLLLSGYYNRSLREQMNTVSVGITVVLRPMQKRKHLSLADRALIEAETGGQ
jgi:hypothetical protein